MAACAHKQPNGQAYSLSSFGESILITIKLINMLQKFEEFGKALTRAEMKNLLGGSRPVDGGGDSPGCGDDCKASSDCGPTGTCNKCTAGKGASGGSGCWTS